jgi:L-fuculose-phosphate aldolase
VESRAPEFDAVILQNHGVMAWGDNLEQAFLRLELVEHLATITHHAMAFGGVQTLDASHLPPLLASRTKAGLGPVARGVLDAPSEVPSPVGVVAPRAPSGKIDRRLLVEIITDELKKL